MRCYNNRVLGYGGSQVTEMDPAAWAQWSAASGAKPVRVTDPVPTINYTMTPERFVLEIPVEALPALTNDAHTRMLAMLSDWIARHKPPVVRVKDPPPPSVERTPFDNGPLTK